MQILAIAVRSAHAQTQVPWAHRANNRANIALRSGSICLMALDWESAFDTIMPQGLLNALDRIGYPQHLLDIIASIYNNRSFLVRDGGATSSCRGQQFSGVCQGCPLSPFLFISLMSVMLHDAYQSLGVEAWRHSKLATRVGCMIFYMPTIR